MHFHRFSLTTWLTVTWTAGLVVTLGAGCRSDTQSASSAAKAHKPKVYVDCYPLEYFAQRIGGDSVDVIFPVPRDEDPAFWQPGPQEIAAYQAADLILLNGAGYARWASYAALPPSRVEETSAAFRDQYVQLTDAVVHKHGPQGEHAHEGWACHTWLDPRLARLQARAVRDALIRLLPDQARQLEQNWGALDRDLAQWEAELERASQPPGRKMWASHPVYDYLARFCRWELKSVHWEPSQVPDQEQWQRFGEQLKEHNAAWMVWEDEPVEDIRRRLAEMGVQTVVFWVCGNRPQSGDFLQAMRENTRRLVDALQSAPASAQQQEAAQPQ